jgi:hypothetical protein
MASIQTRKYILEMPGRHEVQMKVIMMESSPVCEKLPV